jgi:hypothetical protein
LLQTTANGESEQAEERTRGRSTNKSFDSNSAALPLNICLPSIQIATEERAPDRQGSNPRKEEICFALRKLDVSGKQELPRTA